MRWHFGRYYEDISFTPDITSFYKVLYDANKIYINNTLYSTLKDTSFSNDIPLYIFARNNENNTDAFASVKLRSLSIMYSNDLTREFIPCYRKSDNKPRLI